MYELVNLDTAFQAEDISTLVLKIIQGVVSALDSISLNHGLLTLSILETGDTRKLQ